MDKEAKFQTLHPATGGGEQRASGKRPDQETYPARHFCLLSKNTQRAGFVYCDLLRKWPTDLRMLSMGYGDSRHRARNVNFAEVPNIHNI